MFYVVYWLSTAILAYLFFGFASFFDKLVLVGRPKPKSYTFYVGVFSVFVIVFIPLVKFSVPDATGLTWIILDAIVHILGLYTMFVALEKFDVSKVVATIGATQPIFIFALTWFVWGPQTLPLVDLIAFIILFISSIIISIEKNVVITGNYLKITLFSSAMFSLDYIFSKFVFIDQQFLPGIIWIGIFVFLFVFVFLLGKDSRKEIFSKQMILEKRTQATFLAAQICGGAANFFQSFAISLAPIAFLATVNSLRGIQYVFLFMIIIFVSVFYPKILKEELSKAIIFRKIISIILISVGLAMLVIY